MSSTPIANVYQLNNPDQRQVAVAAKATTAGMRDPMTQAEEPAYGRALQCLAEEDLNYDLVLADKCIDKLLRPSSHPDVYKRFQHRSQLADPEVVDSLYEKLFKFGEQQKNPVYWIEYSNALGKTEIICPFGIRRTEAVAKAQADGLDISNFYVILIDQHVDGSTLTEQDALKLSVILSAMSNAGAEGVADPTSQSEKGRALALVMAANGWTDSENKEEIEKFAKLAFPCCRGEDSRSKQAFTNVYRYALGERIGINLRMDVGHEYIKEVYERKFSNEEWNPEENNGSNGVLQLQLGTFNMQQLWLKMMPPSVSMCPNDLHLVITDHNKQTEESLQKFHADLPSQLQKWNDNYKNSFIYAPTAMSVTLIARTSLPNDVDKAWIYSKTKREWTEV
jgi:hypothetical protein